MSMTDPARHGTPSWFDLMTPDPEAAMTFYGAVFGWEFTPDSGPEMGHYRMAICDGQLAAGLGKSQDPSLPPAWTVYMAADSADAMAEAVTTAGGQVLAPPMDIADAGRMAIFTDPTGAVFGCWENGQHTGAQIRDAHGAMTWCEVNTPDAGAARPFYQAVLGLETRKMGGMQYWTLNEGDKAHCGILQMTAEWGDMPAHWMVYFAVDDMDAAVAAIEAGGGSVRFPPFDTPYGRIAVCTDPAGAAFTVLRPPA